MRMDKIMEKLDNRMAELKKEVDSNYYFTGTDTQGTTITEYVGDSIKSIFDQLYDKNLIDEQSLNEFITIDEVTDTAALKMTEEDMKDVITMNSCYYNRLASK